jgi:hypothetical protein
VDDDGSRIARGIQIADGVGGGSAAEHVVQRDGEGAGSRKTRRGHQLAGTVLDEVVDGRLGSRLPGQHDRCGRVRNIQDGKAVEVTDVGPAAAREQLAPRLQRGRPAGYRDSGQFLQGGSDPTKQPEIDGRQGVKHITDHRKVLNRNAESDWLKEAGGHQIHDLDIGAAPEIAEGRGQREREHTGTGEVGEDRGLRREAKVEQTGAIAPADQGQTTVQCHGPSLGYVDLGDPDR